MVAETVAFERQLREAATREVFLKFQFAFCFGEILI